MFSIPRILRVFTQLACILTFVGSVAAPWLHAAAPNVVVIMSDDMGYSDLGCFGGEIETPNLDGLASGGLRFTNFYSENMCWVSRAALLTGVYHKASMVDSALHPRCVTLPEALRANGFQTRMSGKWHLAGKGYEVNPLDRGFEHFYGILGGSASYFAPAFLSRDRTNVESEAETNPDYYLTDAISDEAVRMVVEADAEKPLFLYVAYTAAHWPLHVPESQIDSYRGRYALGWDELRKQRLARMQHLGTVADDIGLSPRHENVPAWEDEPHRAWQQRRMEVYAAQISIMDRGIGRIVDALKQTGRFDDTLVFYTIDNGGCHVEYTPDRKGDYLPEMTRDGRPMQPGNLPDIMPGPEVTYQSYGHGWANVSNTPYRLFKQYDHEGGIRTPMIAHWPNGIAPQGTIVPAVSHLIDIMPTILEVTNTSLNHESAPESPLPQDGLSLAAAFEGQSIVGHETLFFDHNKGKALRKGDWKLVSQSGKAWELYDLASDPLELQDRAAEMPDKAAELEAIWKSESERLARLSQ